MKKLFFTAVAALATLTLSAQTQVIAHRGFHAKEGSDKNNLSQKKIFRTIHFSFCS